MVWRIPPDQRGLAIVMEDEKCYTAGEREALKITVGSELYLYQCEDCHWFVLDTRLDGSGTCWRFPPVVTAKGTSTRPRVDVSNTCGEWLDVGDYTGRIRR
jgi:extradiol dioxygenase family protein